jgi:hypothetical protein
VFLTADEKIRPEHLEGTPVLYWQDMFELATQCGETYVARRLESALDRYKHEFGGAARPAEWKLVRGLDGVLLECRRKGDRVEIGYERGIEDLVATPLQALTLRTQPWKVRDIEGIRTSDRWKLGEDFAQVIDEKRDRLPRTRNTHTSLMPEVLESVVPAVGIHQDLLVTA